MSYLFETYLQTINPENDYSILNSQQVMHSIIIHLFMYVLAYNFLMNIFDLPDKTLMITISLVVIMLLGYYGRLARSKSIYNYFLNKGIKKEKSKKLAIEYMNSAYFTWYFMG